MLLVLEEVLEEVLEDLRTRVSWSNYETEWLQWWDLSTGTGRGKLA